MYAVEFTTKIKNGKIDVPLQYRNKLNSDVKVILLMPEQQEVIPKSNQEKMAKGFGALAHLANPDLWEQEEGAWERAVAEKYAID